MTKSNHSERMKEITDKLEAGVKEVFSGGRYAAYLQTMSKFPRYSFRNTMLIYLQNPGATRVAGFQTWKSLGRSVNKGETGLQILAPSCPSHSRNKLRYPHSSLWLSSTSPKQVAKNCPI